MSPIEQVILNKKTQINPIWIMRQAGRYLPEFRKIRKQNPDLIKEVATEEVTKENTEDNIEQEETITNSLPVI